METDRIAFTVPGDPRGKGRPRFVRATGRAFTDAATTSYENLIRHCAAQAMAGRPPLTGPIRLDVWAFLAVPNGWPTWKKDGAYDGWIKPTVKPDFDNVTKVLGDGMNGVAWVDDAHVTECTIYKAYSRTPRLEVVITPLDAHPAQITRKRDLEADRDL